MVLTCGRQQRGARHEQRQQQQRPPDVNTLPRHFRKCPTHSTRMATKGNPLRRLLRRCRRSSLHHHHHQQQQQQQQHPARSLRSLPIPIRTSARHRKHKRNRSRNCARSLYHRRPRCRSPRSRASPRILLTMTTGVMGEAPAATTTMATNSRPSSRLCETWDSRTTNATATCSSRLTDRSITRSSCSCRGGPHRRCQIVPRRCLLCHSRRNNNNNNLPLHQPCRSEPRQFRCLRHLPRLHSKSPESISSS